MPTKTKKARVKVQATPVTAKVEKKLSTEQSFSYSDLLPVSFVFLYLFVDFIPRFDGADVMGAQWIYVVVVNMAAAIYMFITRKNTSTALTAVGKSVATILFSALFLLAGASIFIAMNKIESLVTYARFAATFIAFFTMAVMLFNRPHLFRILAQILGVFLLIQSIDLLNQFFSGFDTLPLTELVNSLKSNSGNKNIMAASLVMKIPFVLYCIYNQKAFGKVVNITILALAALTIFFINARASFISLFLVALIFSAYVTYEYLQEKKVAYLLKRLAYIIVPVIITFAISNVILQTKVEYLNEGDNSGYGAVTERLKTLSLSQQANSLRMNQFKSAIQHIKANPLMGAGYGNWKLASIPYERSYSDEMYISYHVHNDFLEFGAELGLPGGLLYLSIYIALLVLSLKVVFSKTATRQQKQMAAFSLMALAVYFVDAMFNFPIERPIMQMYLAFIIALHVNIYLQSRKQITEQKKWTAPVFTALAILLMVPSFYFTQTTYKSMIAQGIYNADMLSGNPVYKSAQVIPALPDIPNLNVFGFPIDAIKARYLLAEKKYDESLALLNASAHINPYITYNEFLKGNLFLERGQIDSAYHYAEKAFFMKPRAKSNYQLFNAVLAQKKDSAMATKAFNEIIQFRDEPWVYNDYINILYICGKDYKTLFQIADGAIKKFPNDPDIMKKHAELNNLQNVPR